MLKEKLKDLNVLFYITLSILIVACTLLFIQNIKLNRIIGNIYFNNLNERAYNRRFTREYNKLLDDYEKKRIELMRLEEIIRRKNSIYNDFFDINYQDKFFENFIDIEKELDIIKKKRNEIGNIIEKQEDSSNETKKVENIKNKNQENKKSSKNQRNGFVYNAKVEKNEKEFTVKVKLPRTFTLDDVKVDLKDNNLILKVEKQTNVKKENEKFYSYNSFFESFSIPETKAELKDIKTTLNNNELVVIVPIIK